jgi:predicted small secreted protein
MGRRLATALVALAAFTFTACNDDDGNGVGTGVQDDARDGVERATDAVGDAWASFRTGFERLVDRAATGDNEAQEEILEQCRDALEEMRQEDDPQAERMERLCDDIRNADDQADWNALRQAVEQMHAGR